MDKNKLQKLKEISYEMHDCCGLCKHGVFRSSEGDFGVCATQTYNHLKHSEAERNLSINKYGICKSGFELSPTQKKYLGLWMELYEKL